MQPEIVWFSETKLIGISQTMSLYNYNVEQLWKTFMPRRFEIHNNISSDLFHVQVNPKDYTFDPNVTFEKWATIAVTDAVYIPQGMKVLTIPEGRYAVFTYRGDGSDASEFYRTIFTQWLPQFGLIWENRIQFEILGSLYQKNSPTSEERIFIPIQ